MKDERATRVAAFTYEIDHATRTVQLTYRRQPEFTEWRALMTQILDDPQFRPGFNLLSDRRALTEAAAAGVIRNMALFVARHRKMFEGCRWAVVVAPWQLAEYGMARMGSALFEGSRVDLRAFTDFDVALHWLQEGGSSATTRSALYL